MTTQGLIYVFTGDGKGKTSAALGVAIRSLAAGLKVAMIQWYKDPAWRTSDPNINTLLNSQAKARFQLHPMGQGFFLGTKTAPLTTGQIVVDKATRNDHHQAANSALKLAHQLINQVDVLILDEVNNAVSDGLIDVADLIKLIENRKSTHLVLTGRNASSQIISLANLVTEMKKIKHPYDLGLPAVKGLDF